MTVYNWRAVVPVLSCFSTARHGFPDVGRVCVAAPSQFVTRNEVLLLTARVFW
jgi:hypothetical protein